MFGLGEEVKGLDPAQRVTVSVECLKVSDLGGWITGHVDNSLRLEGKELLEEILAASFPGWVNDNGGPICRKGHLFKDVFCGSCQNRDVFKIVLEGILSSPVR